MIRLPAPLESAIGAALVLALALLTLPGVRVLRADTTVATLASVDPGFDGRVHWPASAEEEAGATASAPYADLPAAPPAAPAR